MVRYKYEATMIRVHKVHCHVPGKYAEIWEANMRRLRRMRGQV